MMKFSMQFLALLVLLLGLEGIALAQQQRPGQTNRPSVRPGPTPPPARVPEIDPGSAASALALLIGGGALLRERLRSK